LRWNTRAVWTTCAYERTTNPGAPDEEKDPNDNVANRNND